MPEGKTMNIIRLSMFVLSASLAAAAVAQQPANTPAADASQLEEVVIFARGVARQQQQVTAEQIDYLPAGTSPLKAIEKLPGVNFQSADPFGSYEWSTRIVVRGFNQNQLGFTLDGVPLGDMSYGNHNGLHISRAVPSEDVGRVSLSQGAGALSTASTSNLGGTLEFFTLEPAADFGGRVDLTGGSDSTRRIFGRFDTGALGGNGPRISLSAVDGTTDKWKGSGEQQQRMYSLKAVQPIGDTGSVTAYYNYSDRAERDYHDLSFDIIRRRGEDWDNWAPDWSAAVSAAQACAASGFSNAVACDDAYWDAAGLREDSLAYVGVDLPSDDGLSFSARVYMHQNEGQGLWGTPYVPTPGGAPLSVRTTEYDIDRKGALATVGWTLGGHALEAGVWIENNDFNQARRFYPESSLAGPTQSFTSFRSDPLLTQWEYAFETKTLQYHLQDEFSIGETLKFVAGFKGMTVENSATTITGPNKSGTIEAQENFLPQLGFTWAPWEGGELFGLAARNARAFVSANTAGPFSTSAAGFVAIRDVLKPETSDTIELGWRFRGESVEGVLAAYRIKFKDRLLAIQQGPGIVGNPSVLANVGGVSTNGFEAAVNWRPMQHLAWFTSFAWNDSTFDQNYTTNGNVILVGGKTVPDAPEMMLKTELTYDNGMFFARADANYTDGRYYTFLNQGSVPSYTLFNASAGFRFADLAMFEELSVQAAVTNIADKFYISTVGSNGFVNADPNGTAQTLLRGAPRQVFVSVKAKF
jgi:iron complex outermembrane receptor protein